MILLESVAWISIFIGIMQAVYITIDVIKTPQKTMPIMNIVWPLTGLYFPVLGLLTYLKLGKGHTRHRVKHNGHHMHHHENKPFWQSVFVSTTHCSSGCSLGDMIGVPIVALTGLTIAGSTLFADYMVEFILAYIFGIAFQYYGMGFSKKGEPRKAIKDAIKADTLALIAFEIGMFGWMAIVHYVIFTQPPEPITSVFWFMMQIAMMLGFLTSYPANWVLVQKGVKHTM
ncbi:DUF4396 domain-containing protein [Salibacterium salarium]|uniref:DUF4396 domain-containing protein n=1 Tax=Salibacterium salarium TaxID=284579 RepID=A0A428N7U6_9BACI|nr:DUF4396 domain-containing protein [Salibacterium salarium]RSL34440.1 DUF4396 domain-containing protein [Salibacterium salarium]